MGRLFGGSVRVRATAAFVVACAALAGCGGDSRADDAAADKSEEAAAGGPTTTVVGGPGGADAGKDPSKQATTTTTAKGAGPRAAAKKSGPSAAGEDGAGGADEGGEKTMEVTAEIADECVPPGGTQTITIHARPNSIVGYNTYYSDGKSGVNEGFHGGNMVGGTEDGESWTNTWVVAATAPPGQAVVVVTGVNEVHGRGETGVVFVVADPLGLCDPPHYEYVYE